MFWVVADTNLYVSALNFGGVAEEIVALGRSGSVTLCVSPSLLEEVERVLLDKFDWSAPRARAAVTAIRGFAALVLLSESVAVISNDEPDNRILECALAGQANRTVSGDPDLEALGN